MHGARGLGEAQHIYTPKSLQAVQHCEDKTNEAIMVLEANSDVLSSIRKFYERLLENKDFPLQASCREDILEFSMQVEDMIYDSKMQIARAKVLVQITEDRKTLVSHSLIITCAFHSKISMPDIIIGSAASSKPGNGENGDPYH